MTYNKQNSISNKASAFFKIMSSKSNIYKFGFKDYMHSAYISINVDKNIDLSKYDYIVFDSEQNQKAIFDFCKSDMQQGEAPHAYNFGRSYFEKMGFFDFYPRRKSQNWKNFKEFSKLVLYSFEIETIQCFDKTTFDVILLNPINLHMNPNTFKTKRDKILSL